MKPYIYLALALLSISLSNVQAADKTWLEEISTSTNHVHPVVVGAIGGTATALSSLVLLLALGDKGDGNHIFAALATGMASGTVIEPVIVRDYKYPIGSIAFWTSFMCAAFAGLETIKPS